MIMALKTDGPTAEIYLLRGRVVLREYKWEAGRKLSSELSAELKKSLTSLNANWGDLTGVVVYLGPGSFTGLRIGITVANTIAYAQSIPIVGARHNDWLDSGSRRLTAREDDGQVLPFYGAEANITRPG